MMETDILYHKCYKILIYVSFRLLLQKEGYVFRVYVCT